MRLTLKAGAGLVLAAILLVTATWLFAPGRSSSAGAFTAATATGTPAAMATPQHPSDAALDAMVNACAQYMSQIPGMPKITPEQMKGMMQMMGNMMGGGGMMQNMMGR